MSLKRLNPDHVSKVCSAQDGAIDSKATGDENLSKFSETHNMSLLTFKEGMKPLLFHVKNIDPEQEADIQEAHYIVQMPDLENLKGEALKKAKPKVKQVKQQRMFMKYFSAGVVAIEDNGKLEKEINPKQWSLAIQQEIGGHIMLQAALGEEEKKS